MGSLVTFEEVLSDIKELKREGFISDFKLNGHEGNGLQSYCYMKVVENYGEDNGGIEQFLNLKPHDLKNPAYMEVIKSLLLDDDKNVCVDSMQFQHMDLHPLVIPYVYSCVSEYLESEIHYLEKYQMDGTVFSWVRMFESLYGFSVVSAEALWTYCPMWSELNASLEAVIMRGEYFIEKGELPESFISMISTIKEGEATAFTKKDLHEFEMLYKPMLPNEGTW